MVFKNLTIRARIGFTMAFLAVLLGVIGALGVYGMTRANDTTREVFTNQMPSAVDVSVAEIYAARERLWLDRGALLAGTPGRGGRRRTKPRDARSPIRGGRNTSRCRAARRTGSHRTSPRSGRRCSTSVTRSRA